MNHAVTADRHHEVARANVSGGHEVVGMAGCVARPCGDEGLNLPPVLFHASTDLWPCFPTASVAAGGVDDDLNASHAG